MDNSNNFQDDFVKSVQSAPVVNSSTHSDNSKKLIVAIIILSALVIGLAIALFVVAFSYRNYLNDSDPITEDVHSSYVYDENSNLVSIELYCTSASHIYIFDNNNKYALYTQNSEAIADETLDSGTYVFADGTHLALTSELGNSAKTITFVNEKIADSGEIYTCETY